MLAFHQTHQFISDAIDHDQHFFVGADDVVVKRCTFDYRLRRACQVSRFINHHWRITRTSGNQTFVGVLTRGVHYGFTTGHHQQADTWVLEQTLGSLDIRVGNRHQQVCRTACGNHRLVKQSDSALRDFFRRRMRCENHAVTSGNQADGKFIFDTSHAGFSDGKFR